MEQQVKKIRYVFITFLKALAALLIINSHYDQIYPIAALATGGAIGNAVFFAVSGFCLYPVYEKFIHWLPSRLIKIYIPTIIMTIVALFTYKKEEFTFESAISIFVWPTFFWFIGAIVVFYFLYYILKNVHSNRAFLILGLILTALYFFYYIIFLDKSTWVIETKGLHSVESYFKLIYYFAAMMIGKWFRINADKIHKKNIFYVFGIIVSFLSIYVVKFILMKVPAMMPLQCLNQISVLALVIFLFLFSLSVEDHLDHIKNTRFYRCADYISRITLHLYLVQFLVIEYTCTLKFPINFLIATAGILGLASVLSLLSNYIVMKLKFLNRKK